MAQRVDAALENSHILDQASDTSSFLQTPNLNQRNEKEERESRPKREIRLAPAEYVSLFEEVDLETFKEYRDARLDPYKAVLTGINFLLVDVSDYVKGVHTREHPPYRQVLPRLM